MTGKDSLHLSSSSPAKYIPCNNLGMTRSPARKRLPRPVYHPIRRGPPKRVNNLVRPCDKCKQTLHRVMGPPPQPLPETRRKGKQTPFTFPPPQPLPETRNNNKSVQDQTHSHGKIEQNHGTLVHSCNMLDLDQASSPDEKSRRPFQPPPEEKKEDSDSLPRKSIQPLGDMKPVRFRKAPQTKEPVLQWARTLIFQKMGNGKTRIRAHYEGLNSMADKKCLRQLPAGATIPIRSIELRHPD